VFAMHEGFVQSSPTGKVTVAVVVALTVALATGCGGRSGGAGGGGNGGRAIGRDASHDPRGTRVRAGAGGLEVGRQVSGPCRVATLQLRGLARRQLAARAARDLGSQARFVTEAGGVLEQLSSQLIPRASSRDRAAVAAYARDLRVQGMDLRSLGGAITRRDLRLARAIQSHLDEEAVRTRLDASHARLSACVGPTR
jgi:hypothetical protein